jgi:hypothetical protein
MKNLMAFNILIHLLYRGFVSICQGVHYEERVIIKSTLGVEK